ncbi:SLC13 family permease [Arthrobacter sp. B6]|uniref:SLC13 family permease n=1 Tax=Arthrobacter sp. B6 TaxID=1570137 RepID=UPI00082F7385|nr:SLC13 family permease [Arthrobacter sp. B6]
MTERTIAETTAPYANPIVVLFLGGFLIAIAMQKWNLHRRIALLTLRRVGTHARRIILGLMMRAGNPAGQPSQRHRRWLHQR